jgi:hypothetical protein
MRGPKTTRAPDQGPGRGQLGDAVPGVPGLEALVLGGSVGILGARVGSVVGLAIILGEIEVIVGSVVAAQLVAGPLAGAGQPAGGGTGAVAAGAGFVVLSLAEPHPVGWDVDGRGAGWSAVGSGVWGGGWCGVAGAGCGRRGSVDIRYREPELLEHVLAPAAEEAKKQQYDDQDYRDDGADTAAAGVPVAAAGWGRGLAGGVAARGVAAGGVAFGSELVGGVAGVGGALLGVGGAPVGLIALGDERFRGD